MHDLLVGAAFILIGAVFGFVAAGRRSHGDREFLERQIAAHVDSLERQLKTRTDSAERQRRQEKLEHAYEQLMMWLHDLERVLDEVWAGCCSSEAVTRERAEVIVDQWPWETLRVPDGLAPVSFYWSSSAAARLREFKGASVDFVFAAKAVLAGMDDDSRPGSSKSIVWEQRGVLIGLLDKVREQAATDLGVVRD